VPGYYNKGGNAGVPNMDGRIRPLFLYAQEDDAIIEFSKT